MQENHGGWYNEMIDLGYNYRLTDFQAALEISQIILAIIAFGLLVALLVGGVFGFGAVAALNGFTAQSWAWGLLCCLVLGGAVLFTLTLLATWSVFTWKLKRPAIIAMLGLLMAGAVCLSGVAIFSADRKTHV